MNIEVDSHKKAIIPMNGYGHIQPPAPGEKRIDKTSYQRIVGKLMHLMVYTRPDIAFALGKLAQFMTDPAENHGQSLKALIRYIRKTKDMKITYGNQNTKIVGYADADYAASKSDRKSTIGRVFMFAGGPIS